MYRQCKYCNKRFKPKSANHFFCNRSHKDQYNKSKDWNGYYKALVKNSKVCRKDLSIEFLLKLHEDQNGLCALSGVELTKITGKGQVTTNSSIDRIKPGGPYSKANVRLVCSFVNGFRGKTTDEELVWWCERIAGNN